MTTRSMPVTWRRMRLVAQMVWRRWFLTAAEQSSRDERRAGWIELGTQQRRAAAAFRWTVLKPDSGAIDSAWQDETDDSG